MIENTAKAVKNTLSEVIRTYRRLTGLTQSELATLAGVGKTVVYDLEHGKETVQWNTVTKVLRVLNVEVILKEPCEAQYPETEVSSIDEKG